MQSAGLKKFLQAAESSDSKRFTVSTALGTHFHNDDRGVIIYDESSNMLYNISKPHGVASGNPMQIRGADLAEIHEVQFVGDFEDVKKFAKALGLKLTEEQDKTLLNIKASNYNLKPATGDYSSFVKLTEEDLAKLTEEQKEEYQKQLAAYEKASRNSNTTPVKETIYVYYVYN